MVHNRKEWKKQTLNQAAFNHELYAFVEDSLANYKRVPLHDIYNDARLITREICDNIFKHDKSAKNITVVILINSAHSAKISIFHDGDEFNPFDPSNDCKLLAARNKEYNFNTTFERNAVSGNFELVLTLDLSKI